MTLFQALFLGLVQGVTEFLPVSSSGHLNLFQHLFGMGGGEEIVLFDLTCHMGTLVAIFLFFWKPISSLSKQKVAHIFLGTIPLFVLFPFLKWFEKWYASPEYLGFFFITSALILLIGIRLGHTHPFPSRGKGSFAIGLAQGVALLPGISRSGATMSMARILGWSKEEALTFSFLLAIPAIVGGMALKTILYVTTPSVASEALPPLCYAAGYLTSMLVGVCTLKILTDLFSKDRFMYFVWYCLFLGLFTTLYFLRHS